MAHTFVGDNDDEIKTIAQPAMAEYLRVNIEMQKVHSDGTKDDRGRFAENELGEAGTFQFQRPGN